MYRKVALITGGSMGLGKAIAEHFGNVGYEVATCARSGNVTHHCDVSDSDEVHHLAEVIEKDFGRLDVLVNNAAIYGPVAQIDDTDPDEWLKALKINLFGPVLMCHVMLPMMRQQGHGKIINVSGAGVRPQKECTAYNASKAGLLRFTEALATDLEGTGIDVNSVAPGTLDTRMRLRSPMPDDPDKAMQQACKCIEWLASSASDGITGRLFSAIWDVGKVLKDLGPDDFRMRRVVPGE